MKVKLSNILVPRFPPFLWNIFIYLFGLLYFFLQERNILFFTCFLLSIIEFSNIFFDFFTISIELSTTSFPNYKQNYLFNLYIYDKKYYLKPMLPNRFESHDETRDCILIDKNNTYINVYIYSGNDNNIEITLYFIYLFGLTKKNYTREHKNNFIESEYFFS
jgi:hypothetical protein